MIKHTLLIATLALNNSIAVITDEPTPTCDEVLIQCAKTLGACDTAVKDAQHESALQEALNNEQRAENQQLREQLTVDKASAFFTSPTIMVPLGFILGVFVTKQVAK